MLKKTKAQLYLIERELTGVSGGSDGKGPACNAGDAVLIPGSGRSHRERNGNPFQWFGLGNVLDRGAWWAAVHGVAKN